MTPVRDRTRFHVAGRILASVVVALALVPLWHPANARAAILHVPADYATIQDAVDAAVDGDVVAVAAGTYSDPVVIPPVSLTLRSEQSNPNFVTLDGASLPSGTRMVTFTGNPIGGNRTIQGITIRNCSDTAVYVFPAANANRTIIANCRFEDNGPMTAVICEGRFITIRDSEFSDNEGYLFGGAARISGSAIIRRNTFRNNDSLPYQGNIYAQGGAIYMLSTTGREGSDVTIQDNTFEGNHCTDYGGAIEVTTFFNCLIENNVFVANSADACAGSIYVVANTQYDVEINNNFFMGDISPAGAAIGIEYSANTIVRNNTIVQAVGNEGLKTVTSTNLTIEANLVALGDGWGIRTLNTSGSLQCNNSYDNALGDYVSSGQGGTNFTLDPLFCNELNDDFSLESASPCLPQNNSCGLLIGVYSEGCQDVAVERATWGLVKERYSSD